MKMILLGLPFRTLMCSLEQHRPIPHLGQRYVQGSCNIALSKKAPWFGPVSTLKWLPVFWWSTTVSDNTCCMSFARNYGNCFNVLPHAARVVHAAAGKELFSEWDKELAAEHTQWQLQSYWENCLTIGSWLVPRAVFPHSLTAVCRHHVLALWKIWSWAQCASSEHQLALPVCTLPLSERCIFLSPVSNSADCAQEHPKPISSSFSITLNIHLF